MSAEKKPTLKEKVRVYEELLHDIQLHTEVTGRPEVVRALIGRICAWSRAHRNGNGRTTEKERQELIDRAFWNLSREMR